MVSLCLPSFGFFSRIVSAPFLPVARATLVGEHLRAVLDLDLAKGGVVAR